MHRPGLVNLVDTNVNTGSGFEMQEHKLTESKLTRDVVCVEGFEVQMQRCTDVCTLMQRVTAA